MSPKEQLLHLEVEKVLSTVSLKKQLDFYTVQSIIKRMTEIIDFEITDRKLEALTARFCDPRGIEYQPFLKYNQ
jgi:hypothetical protein